MNSTLNKNQAEILKAVLYFDVFRYPLTEAELYENCSLKIGKNEFLAELLNLIERNLLKKYDDFILNIEADEKDVIKRLKGNQAAREIMSTAYKYSRKIASFPFVEGVCLSGSLSKNYYDDSSDIDYFIITKPNRLWICRTLLVTRYKITRKSRKKYWCTNYFITSDSLGIPDINAFTSTELAYLIPTINYEAYKVLLEKNIWYRNWYPNKLEAPAANCYDTSGHFFKSVFEKLLQGKFGQWLDNYLLDLTLNRWRKKFPEYSTEDFELQFRSRKDVCKRHTKGFQNKVLILWEEKLRKFENKTNLILSA